MKQDSMVVEYRGDLLRPKMSDDRQKLYNRIGKDCYLFNVNDDVVIDATMTGAVGRFTVQPYLFLPSVHFNAVLSAVAARQTFDIWISNSAVCALSAQLYRRKTQRRTKEKKLCSRQNARLSVMSCSNKGIWPYDTAYNFCCLSDSGAMHRVHLHMLRWATQLGCTAAESLLCAQHVHQSP